MAFSSITNLPPRKSIKMKPKRFLTIVITSFAFCYGLFAFILMDLNPAEWTIGARIGYIIMSFGLLMVSSIVIKDSEEST